MPVAQQKAQKNICPDTLVSHLIDILLYS